ncbi:TAXI family TRAP transporter solute-binding subunit [Magnetospirillum sp. 15-1]|uniref:TAXI family TRAP transporter solute-binding subunit n=1 Tax=Magnetospirillum sp. 15-1 TaxID=1979370 RepID=UPI000BBC9EF7|nr:TAXI family TRAP transporter solute-binding subunit [Magnetospirillum sp. 15-1]
MKRVIVGAVLASFLTLPALAADQFLNILTGGTSGVYYPLGNALSSIFGKALPGARVTVQATKASVENLNLLQAGRGELAFTLGDSLTQAWEGVEEAGYKAPLRKLRTMAAIYPNYIQIVATADSGIKTLADLKGKRVSVGAPKSGTELNARAIFKAAGLSYSDMKVQYLPFGESVELMKNKQLDATLQSAGLGVSSLRDLATGDDIVIVAISPEVIAKTGDSAYIASVVPANTYRGQTTDVPTAAVRNFLVTHEGVPAEVVYSMTKAMFTNMPDLLAAHSAAREIQPENAAKSPIPLHPGAEKYYREAGLLK